MTGKTSSETKKHNIPRHGYRTHYSNYTILKKLDKGLKLRADEDRDSVVLILGYNGVGKSALKAGITLLYDNYYRLEKQMFWNEKGYAFTKKINQIIKERPNDPYKAIDLDEMKNQFDSQTPFMALDNKEATNEMTENREDNLLIIGATPVFKGISRYMREDRVKYIIFVYERGKAVMVKNLYSIFGGYWGFDILKKAIDQAYSKGREPSKQEILKAFNKMPGAWKINGRLVIIRFPDFPPGFKEKYKKWKTKKRREEKIKEMEEKQQKRNQPSQLEKRYRKWLQGLIYYLVEKKGMSRRGIARMLDKYLDDAPSAKAVADYYNEYREENKQDSVTANVEDSNRNHIRNKHKGGENNK